MNPNIKESLKEAGLTENESKIYFSLLELGPSQAGILSRKSGLYRRVVYDTTDMMIKKGIIGYILKNNKRLFQAVNPNRILEILKEKEQSVSENLPQLMTMFLKTKEKEETNFYKGKNGLKSVFEDQIEEAKKSKDREVLIISPFPLAYEVLPFYFKWYDQKRSRENIRTRIIFEKTKEEKMRKIVLSQIRFLPEKYSSHLAINIYGDKVAIILWSKENPLAIVIKNKEIAEGYRKHFELMWKISKG